MDRTRPNALHEKLSVEERKAVERDLVEQPPGRSTYEEVYEFHHLADKGINIKTVQRYGGCLRSIARNQWISQLSGVLAAKQVGPQIPDLIRSQVIELLVTGEANMGDLLKAGIAEKTLTDSEVKREEWESKKAAALAAASRSEKVANPERALSQLREDIRTIYGMPTEPQRQSE